MTESEQTKAFELDLNALIERYRAEFNLTYAAVIGTLFLKAQQLGLEAAENTTDEQ